MRQIAGNGIGDRHDRPVDHRIKKESTQHDTDDLADMDLGKVMEYGERGTTVQQPHEAGPRDAGVPPSYRTFEGARPGPSHVATAPPLPSSSDVWAGALARLQTQVSLNTSMLESHRRQVGDIEQAVGRLQQEMGHVVAVMHEMRAELHARLQSMEQVRHDSGDMDVLASQIATVTDKANEVDGLKMQVELMRNRMKRFEEHASPAARPGTSSTRELYETTPMPSHSQPPMHAQHLPPMRNVSTYGPPTDRSYGGPPPTTVLPSQGHPPYPPRPELRIPSNEQPPVQVARPSSYRPADPLPPPSALSGWRSAETHGLPPPPQQQLEAPVPFRPHTMGQEFPNSGWAAVNANPAIKRPFEEQRQSPYGPPSAPGSPKRPRLAPIMPRSSHAEESYSARSSSMQQTPMSAPPDGPIQSRSRALSNSSQMQAQILPTPASANASSYRFITSTAEADPQLGWRPEPESTELIQPAPPPGGGGKGRGSRRRGGGRGRGSRGGARHQPHVSQELSAIEPQRADQTNSLVSPNDYNNPMFPTAGAPMLQRADGPSLLDPTHRVIEPSDFPATPVSAHQHQHQHQDPFAPSSQADLLLLSNSSKKSRSKPTRNADGVLIRKDGRPDMRSVSSANNLRKVHAKREAERVGEGDDGEEGRTPGEGRDGGTGSYEGEGEGDERDERDGDRDREGRSGTPDSRGVGDGEGGADERSTQRRHREFMGRMFPRGINGVGGRGRGSDYSPRGEGEGETGMKKEEEEEEEEEGEREEEEEEGQRHAVRNNDNNAQTTMTTTARCHSLDIDIATREASEAHPDEPAAERPPLFPEVVKSEPVPHAGPEFPPEDRRERAVGEEEEEEEEEPQSAGLSSTEPSAETSSAAPAE
ncbi:hypothetical protein B0A55_00522 [Friedmanniomyces simplex]|uniref:Uncharacterized protein n=1 Tax=Friedmanniomyces simplex TaxID=329884 RepID=A0A4U0Y4U3_9PEZI|nr:hypothetical protein B0A55_00522 [Friedmanniomyces simplex]